jgi:hypothetical protein
MAKSDLVFEFSPTQEKFVYSDAHIVQLVGPMGEGKTHAGVGGIIHHADRCRASLNGASLRGALIRDTHTNIKISTVDSIKEILRDWVVFKEDCRKMYILTNPPIDFDLFGIDDPASVSKLQGPGYGIIWLEEPAPILERANAGLPKDVFLMACARCARLTGSIPRLQITHNPSDELHWTSELMEDPREYMVAEDGTIIFKETFHIAKGENKHLTPIQRAMNQAAFKSDKSKYERYVEGKTATVTEGKKVTPGYNPDIHFSQRILPVYQNLMGFRGWDGYGHPCCLVAQFNPAGQFVIHDVLYDEGIGTEELIEEQLFPLLALPKYEKKIFDWRDIGDPTMAAKDQSSSRRTAAKVIHDKLGTHFELGPKIWLNRIEPMTYNLKRLVGNGQPAIILSASAKRLHRALRGGWHFNVDNSGNVIGKIPDKNEHSHPGDAFASLIAKLMPYAAKKVLTTRNREAEIARINSYATGGRRSPGYRVGGVL